MRLLLICYLLSGCGYVPVEETSQATAGDPVYVGASQGTGPYASGEIWFGTSTGTGIRQQGDAAGLGNSTNQLYFEGSKGSDADSTHAGGKGGLTAVVGGLGGCGTSTQAPGNGGTLIVSGGESGGSNTGGACSYQGYGNADGGGLTLRGGTHSGNGSDGIVAIGDARTASVQLGHASNPSVSTMVMGSLLLSSSGISSTASTNVLLQPPNGADGSGSTPGSTAPQIVLQGARGGAGTSSAAPGAGGSINLFCGAAGTQNGSGYANGGTFNVQVGTASGGVNGAINLGTAGPAPSSINLGQTNVPINMTGSITVTGQLQATTAEWMPEVVDPASNTIMTSTQYRALFTAGIANDRAIYFPAVSTLSAGRVYRFEVSCSNSGHTIYVYAYGTGTLIKTMTCTASHLLIAEGSYNDGQYRIVADL